MQPTYIGFIVVAIAFVLFWRSMTALLVLTLICTLFGGSSALDLPALGGASIQPCYVALGFLVLRVIFAAVNRTVGILWALWHNAFLAAFSFYGATTAFILPRLFAGEVDVRSNVRGVVGDIFYTQPLAFTPQNITQAVYLIGTLMAALAATIVARNEQCRGAVVRAGVALAWLHTGAGLLDLILDFAGHSEIWKFVRNASYAQLDQSFGGWKRIAGTYPEPSAFCQCGFVWFVLNAELWLRGIRPRQTGPAALALLIILMITTSTTAYGSLGLYFVLLLLRLIIFPMRLTVARSLTLGVVALLTVGVLLTIVLSAPEIAHEATRIFGTVTFNKMESESGTQRAFWVQKSLEAFVASHGLGVGAGSVRSSSLVAAILGSMGVVGITTLLAYLWMTLKPFRVSTHRLRQTPDDAVAAAVSWAAVLTLVPLTLNGATPDPGLIFGMLSGLAVGWRAPQIARGASRSWRRPAAPMAAR